MPVVRYHHHLIGSAFLGSIFFGFQTDFRFCISQTTKYDTQTFLCCTGETQGETDEPTNRTTEKQRKWGSWQETFMLLWIYFFGWAFFDLSVLLFPTPLLIDDINQRAENIDSRFSSACTFKGIDDLFVAQCTDDSGVAWFGNSWIFLKISSCENSQIKQAVQCL